MRAFFEIHLASMIEQDYALFKIYKRRLLKK